MAEEPAPQWLDIEADSRYKWFAKWHEYSSAKQDIQRGAETSSLIDGDAISSSMIRIGETLLQSKSTAIRARRLQPLHSTLRLKQQYNVATADAQNCRLPGDAGHTRYAKCQCVPLTSGSERAITRRGYRPVINHRYHYGPKQTSDETNTIKRMALKFTQVNA